MLDGPYRRRQRRDPLATIIFWTLLVFGVLVALAYAPRVFAQDDVRLGPPQAGQWNVRASWPPEPDMAEVCFYVPATGAELGCGDTPVADPGSPTGQSVSRLVTVAAPSPPADVCIRAYARDTAGNRSVDSANCAIADFVAPAAPEVL